MWTSFRSGNRLSRSLARIGLPVSRPAPLSAAGIVAGAVESAAASGFRLDSGQAEMLDRVAKLPALPNGLYLHGDVGRGKTWLADLVFGQFPEPKRRLHCHELLAEINATIARRVSGVGGRSTAEHIASVVEGFRYLMIDDFHVHDVADGKLLSNILNVLRRQGTFMLLTSNYAPAELLPNPFFHSTFVPAITLIEERCEVVEIAAGRDHRRHARHEGGFGSGTWSVSTDREGTAEPPSPLSPSRLPPEGESRSVSSTFAELCERPYSVADYFALVSDLDGLLLRGVPAPERIGEEPFQRFAFLIDALADSDVRLDIEAAVGPEAFGRAPNLPRDSARLLSRLALLNSSDRQHLSSPDRKGPDSA